MAPWPKYLPDFRASTQPESRKNTSEGLVPSSTKFVSTFIRIGSNFRMKWA